MSPVLGDQLVEVVRQLTGRGDAALDHLGRRKRRGQQVRGGGRPFGEALAIGERHAHHLADDRRRHRQRQVGDDVHLAALGDAIEQLVDQHLDARPQRLDGARAKRLVHQLAQPRVIRRVLLQDELPGPAGEGRAAQRVAVGKAHAGRHFLQHAHDVVVARQPEEADRRLVDGIMLAQALQERIRIGAKRGIERVDAEPRVVFPRFVRTVCCLRPRVHRASSTTMPSLESSAGRSEAVTRVSGR